MEKGRWWLRLWINAGHQVVQSGMSPAPDALSKVDNESCRPPCFLTPPPDAQRVKKSSRLPSRPNPRPATRINPVYFTRHHAREMPDNESLAMANRGLKDRRAAGSAGVGRVIWPDITSRLCMDPSPHLHQVAQRMISPD